jgi:hypothetical protein
MERLPLQYLKQVARNTGADSYTAMKRMACNNCRWKAANQSKEEEKRRRRGEGEEEQKNKKQEEEEEGSSSKFRHAYEGG